MPLWILQNSFSFNKYGYGAAMSMIFVLIVLLGMILVKLIVRGCASSVQVIQSGERPDPAKRSEQPVLSLGAGAAR